MCKEDCFPHLFIERRRLSDGDRYIIRERRFEPLGLCVSVHDLEVHSSLLKAEIALKEVRISHQVQKYAFVSI